MIERHIDFLSFSAPSNQANFSGNEYRVIPPVAFYRAGYEDDKGIRYYFGNPKNPSLAYVVLSGSTLAYMRGAGYTDESILSFAFSQDAKISRIDLAVTKFVDDWFVTVSDVAAWYSMGWFTGALSERGAKTIARLVEDGGMGIETLYIGDLKKRGKRGIFRAYDKGLEFDLEPYLITRLELEERQENAHNTALRIASGEKLAACFRSRLDCACDEFDALMESEPAQLVRGQGKEKTDMEEKLEKRWAWLIEQVAPSLKEALEIERKKDPTTPNLTEFLYAAGLIDEMRRGAGMFDKFNKSDV